MKHQASYQNILKAIENVQTPQPIQNAVSIQSTLTIQEPSLHALDPTNKNILPLENTLVPMNSKHQRTMNQKINNMILTYFK